MNPRRPFSTKSFASSWSPSSLGREGTLEARDFRGRYSEFTALGAEVVCVSSDP